MGVEVIDDKEPEEGKAEEKEDEEVKCIIAQGNETERKIKRG